MDVVRIALLQGDQRSPRAPGPFAHVWSEDQISRLFDSILREYPISTLLIWKTRAEVRHRKFIDNYRSGLRLSDFYVPENGKKKCLVLDGQQRLQSLFIGLCGSYEGRELFLDILSGEISVSMATLMEPPVATLMEPL